MIDDAEPSLDAFREQARDFLTANTVRVSSVDQVVTWGEGSDSTAVIHNLSPNEELALIERFRDWLGRRFAAGLGAIDWPAEYGGAGLTASHAHAYLEEEAKFQVPARNEMLGVTTILVPPTLCRFGTVEQQALIPALLRAHTLCCQLFSEPGAGSDLAGLCTRAERVDDGWVINGQKVWSSGAQFAQWGELLARTDPAVPKHAGITAFLIPMDSPGIEVRPIRQLNGGSSFCEVFLSDVHVPDRTRLGEVGDGWSVALTTLGVERANSGTRQVGGSWGQLLALAQHAGRTDDPVIRQQLAQIYAGLRIDRFNRLRFAASHPANGTSMGTGNIGKLLWSQNLQRIGAVAGELLGPSLIADTGAWGTYAWSEHVLGAPGFRLAGGTDEIQRNILAERVLGLARAPG